MISDNKNLIKDDEDEKNCGFARGGINNLKTKKKCRWQHKSN